MIIKFGDIEIEPYALNELDREESVYTFNFKANVDEFKKFMDFLVSSDTNEKEDYFQVFIDDEPHTMRFGIVGYSEHKQFGSMSINWTLKMLKLLKSTTALRLLASQVT